MKQRQAIAVVALVSITLAVGYGAAGKAESGRSERCTLGDARALLEVLPIPAQLMQPLDQDHPGVLEALTQCQYRVFAPPGASATFCEDDVILGGVARLREYQALGISRAEAIAELALFRDRVWLNDREQTLEETAFKDMLSVLRGHVVYQHRAFIAQLPPGEYVSLWRSTFAGAPARSATVTVRILPRELCT